MELDKPEKNDAELSGPRMSEILEDLHSLPRSLHATETATTTVAVLLIQSMYNVQRSLDSVGDCHSTRDFGL